MHCEVPGATAMSDKCPLCGELEYNPDTKTYCRDVNYIRGCGWVGYHDEALGPAGWSNSKLGLDVISAAVAVAVQLKVDEERLKADERLSYVTNAIEARKRREAKQRQRPESETPPTRALLVDGWTAVETDCSTPLYLWRHPDFPGKIFMADYSFPERVKEDLKRRAAKDDKEQ